MIILHHSVQVGTPRFISVTTEVHHWTWNCASSVRLPHDKEIHT